MPDVRERLDKMIDLGIVVAGRRCYAEALCSPGHRRIIYWLNVDAMLIEEKIASSLTFLRIADHHGHDVSIAHPRRSAQFRSPPRLRTGRSQVPRPRPSRPLAAGAQDTGDFRLRQGVDGQRLSDLRLTETDGRHGDGLRAPTPPRARELMESASRAIGSSDFPPICRSTS
jgi:hypothetical protein